MTDSRKGTDERRFASGSDHRATPWPRGQRHSTFRNLTFCRQRFIIRRLFSKFGVSSFVVSLWTREFNSILFLKNSSKVEPDVEAFGQTSNDFVGDRSFPLVLDSAPRVHQKLKSEMEKKERHKDKD